MLAYLNRDWAAARASKDRAFGRYVEAQGAEAALKLGQALLDQVWPRIKEMKSRDISGLLELRRKLDLAEAERRRLAAENRDSAQAAEDPVVRIRRPSRRRSRRKPLNR